MRKTGNCLLVSFLACFIPAAFTAPGKQIWIEYLGYSNVIMV